MIYHIINKWDNPKKKMIVVQLLHLDWYVDVYCSE